MTEKQISIIIPTLNEEGNIKALVRRIARIFKDGLLTGEIIFIDDHSSDSTSQIIEEMKLKYEDNFSIGFFLKSGKKGKAQSLIEGFQRARFDNIAMLDADLQYPPEAISRMMEKISHGADIVVANRSRHETGLLRLFLSKVFTFIFARFIHGLNFDVQAGLKVFRKTIIEDVVLDPSPWTFDMEFLLSARNYGYVIDTVDITFHERKAGKSKIHIIRAIFEIGWNAILLKIKGRTPLLIQPQAEKSMRGAGIAHKKNRYITHSTLHHDYSALHTFIPWQRNLLLVILAVFVAGLSVRPIMTATAFIAIISAIYFIDVIFNLVLVLRSLNSPPEIKSSRTELKALDRDTLPLYTILCPLYKEANMLQHFVGAMEKIEWPKEKLEVLLLLEEDDKETIRMARSMSLPAYIQIIVVPHSLPKTKPKACNYGISYARGEYIVIYDAEDIPDPWQLKKAYLGFKKAPSNVLCLQAKLNYFNPHQNILTRLFTAEYSLWFDVILTGLQIMNTSIPLGGTSNHFRTKDLLKLEGWDPFNVTEDCDLGIRLFMRGHKTAIIDSVTLEEANSNVKNWLRQRSRWIKGYMQTYLVHMRQPWKFLKKNGWHAFIFQLVVGGKIAFMLINPLLWITTIAYFVLYSIVGPTIHALFPPLVFYIAVFSLVFGNFLYLYYYMVGCAKRKHYWLIKYVFLVPAYWILVSIAAAIAGYQLLIKPHYWEKTHHGLHFIKAKDKIKKKILIGRWQNIAGALKERIPAFVPRNIVDFAFSNKGILVLSVIAANLLNFVFNVYLARKLSFSQLSLVILINTLWYLATIFIGGLAGTVNHRTAFLIGRREDGAARNFLFWTIKRGIYITLSFSLIWIIATPILAKYFQIQSVSILLLFTPALLFGLLSYTFSGFISGNLRFAWSAAIIIAEAFSKLFFAVFLAFLGKEDWVYLSIPLSLMASALVGGIFLHRMPKPRLLPEMRKRNYFPFRFFFSSIFTNISSIIFLSVDILLVKHFFNEEIAGQYSILSLAGKMVYFLGALPFVFMVTLVSWKDGLRQNSKNVFQAIFLSSLGLVSFGVLVFGVFGFFTVPFLFGPKSAAIVGWLPIYAFAIAIFTLANAIVTYHLAKRHYLFSFVSLGSSIALVAGIWISHGSLGQVVQVFFGVSLATFAILGALHYFEKSLPFVKRGMHDFWGIISNHLPQAEPRISTGKRILFFNWRDTTHMFAGGAEMYVHQIARMWVQQGNHVTIFCGNDGKQSRHETIDGINIVRRGGFYLVYAWAFLYYIFRFRGKYDVVVDCENGIPFFTPLYVGKPIFSLMHHVHQEVFYHSLPKPLAWFAGFLEKDLMPFIYRNVKFITVSESSRREMQDLGIGNEGITIVHPGINPEDFSSIIAEKTEHPSILYLGRLKAYKSVNILIQSFCTVLAECPEAKLIIAGSGDEERNLKNLAHQLRLSDKQISFLGQVSEEEKISLFQSSWMVVNPSFMEGWGIVVIEANACGTPVIASNVPGLRDSVQNGKGGYLLPYGDVAAFAKCILGIIHNRELREKMEESSREWAEKFSWQKSAQVFLELISDK